MHGKSVGDENAAEILASSNPINFIPICTSESESSSRARGRIFFFLLLLIGTEEEDSFYPNMHVLIGFLFFSKIKLIK